ncbi:hypothetical protein [Paenibacillus sedimenti]|uniref:MFS transporter n=1 Tax=Paenibacillus sedimenti TaxID=2770274 RepID=A0A926KQB4_9BACL|nr:hypothetical protein [Paenibacillus sedimenti]MBD0380976.1 hypothetical protein [Paenibacillus sedimenti]
MGWQCGTFFCDSGGYLWREMGGYFIGWAYFIYQIGGATGSFLGGWSYEHFGTHLVAYSITTLLLLLASVVSLQLPSQLNFPKKQDLSVKVTL